MLTVEEFTRDYYEKNNPRSYKDTESSFRKAVYAYILRNTNTLKTSGEREGFKTRCLSVLEEMIKNLQSSSTNKEPAIEAEKPSLKRDALAAFDLEHDTNPYKVPHLEPNSSDKGQLDSLRAELDFQTSQKRYLMGEVKVARDRNSSLEKALADFRMQNETQQTNHRYLEEKIEALNQIIYQKEQEKTVLVTQNKSERAQYKLLTEEIQGLNQLKQEAQKTIAELTTANGILQQNIRSLTSKQARTEHLLTLARSEISDGRKQIKELGQRVKTLEEEKNIAEKNNQALSEQYQTLQTKHLGSQREIAELNKIKFSHQEKIRELENKNTQQQADYKDLIAQLEKEIVTLKEKSTEPLPASSSQHSLLCPKVTILLSDDLKIKFKQLGLGTNKTPFTISTIAFAIENEATLTGIYVELEQRKKGFSYEDLPLYKILFRSPLDEALFETHAAFSEEYYPLNEHVRLKDGRVTIKENLVTFMQACTNFESRKRAAKKDLKQPSIKLSDILYDFDTIELVDELPPPIEVMNQTPARQAAAATPLQQPPPAITTTASNQSVGFFKSPQDDVLLENLLGYGSNLSDDFFL